MKAPGKIKRSSRQAVSVLVFLLLSANNGKAQNFYQTDFQSNKNFFQKTMPRQAAFCAEQIDRVVQKTHARKRSVSTLFNPSILSSDLPYRHPGRLPWSAECLPFFCRIERRMGLHNRVLLKFRLGSVEYVDWLEGK